MLDELLEKLLGETKELYNAARNKDFDKIGKVLETRQVTIADLASVINPDAPRSEFQQSLIAKIFEFDAKAAEKLKELSQAQSREASNFNKKAAGILKYNNGIYNLASGQLIDKRD